MTLQGLFDGDASGAIPPLPPFAVLDGRYTSYSSMTVEQLRSYNDWRRLPGPVAVFHGIDIGLGVGYERGLSFDRTK
jgi:hypothetical protein